jgi:glycosyltransferase involved in cell wall biosynthesis
MLLPGYHGILSQGQAEYLDGQGNEMTVPKKNPEPDIKDVNRPYDLELAYTIPYQGPRRFFPESKCRAIIWNFESSILPPGWNIYSRAVDYILPSSKFSYDIFANNGIPEEKLVTVPHGVDTNIFNPDIPPFKLKTKKKVKFLHNAIPHHRKLHERVIRGYVETFSGNDDVCLVLKTKFVKESSKKPFEVDVKNIITSIMAGRKNPPEIEVINTFIPDIGALYTACDVVVSMSSTEGFCLLPGTLVNTARGSVSIENVSNEDFVYTHLGNKKQVVGLTTRKVNENLIDIRRHGSDVWFSGTKNHPHLVVKRKNRRFNELRSLAKDGKLAAKWVGLGEVEKGDLVVIPKPKFDHIVNNIIDIKQYDIPNLQEKDNKVWLKKSFDKRTGVSSVSKIADLAGCSFQYVSETLNHEKAGNTTNLAKQITQIAKTAGYKKPTPLKVDRFIEIDELVAKFFGLYIAEGSVSSNGNSFNINLSSLETYGQNMARNICKKFHIPFCENTNENKYQLSGSGKIVSFVLSKLFGLGAYNKKIPFEFYKAPFIGHLLHGIFYGDGSASNRKYSFCTSSPRLRDDIFQILLSNGIFANLRTDTRSEYDNYIIEIAASFNEKFNRLVKPYKYNSEVILPNGSRNNSIIEGKDCFLVPINKVMETHYKGEVYNLEVEEDHSFCSHGMATHNCLPLLEALACDKLIIAPRHGGQLDFLNDENSILVDTGEMDAPLTMQYWGYMKGATVGDPDIEHFKSLLKRVYNNLEKEKARIIQPAKKTVDKFTWEAAAQIILDLPIPEKSIRIFPKKKVLYVIPYKMAGGGEVWIREALKKLDRSIYEPHIALIGGINTELENLFKDLDVTLEDLSINGKGAALKCLVETGGFSLIHFYNSFGVYLVIREAVKEGLSCRIVETVHSELSWPDSMMKVSAREPFVTAIAAVSNKMARKLLKMGNKNVVSLPQVIDWERFNVPRSKEILGKFNIPTDFVVGFVGRISPEKNISAILSCAKMLPNVSFVIAGSGPQESPLKQMASKLKNVFFVGRRNDVEKWYPAFDLLILPSVVEGMPLVILEAMSAGTPIVASDVGAISEAVFDGITGGLVWNPADPSLFVRVIEQFQKDQDLLRRCSNNARMIASSLNDKTRHFNINHFYNMIFGESK